MGNRGKKNKRGGATPTNSSHPERDEKMDTEESQPLRHSATPMSDSDVVPTSHSDEPSSTLTSGSNTRAPEKAKQTLVVSTPSETKTTRNPKRDTPKNRGASKQRTSHPRARGRGGSTHVPTPSTRYRNPDLPDPDVSFEYEGAEEKPKKVRVKLDPNPLAEAKIHKNNRSYCRNCFYDQPPLPVSTNVYQLAERRGIDLSNTLETGFDVRAEYRGNCPVFVVHIKPFRDPTTGRMVFCEHGTHPRGRSETPVQKRIVHHSETSRDHTPAKRMKDEDTGTVTSELPQTPAPREHAGETLHSKGSGVFTPRLARNWNPPASDPEKSPTVPKPTTLNPEMVDACKVLLRKFIPSTAKAEMNVDDKEKTLKVLKEEIKLITYASAHKEIIQSICEEIENPFKDFPEAMSVYSSPEELTDYFRDSWSELATQANVEEEYKELVQKYNPHPEETPAERSVVTESSNQETLTDTIQTPLMYLPMSLPTKDIQVVLDMPFWQKQQDELQRMQEAYTGNSNKYTHRKLIQDHYDNFIKCDLSQMKPMVYKRFTGIGMRKYQTCYYSENELTLNGQFPDVWSHHTRDVKADWEAYMQDPKRPSNFPTQEEFEKVLTVKYRVNRAPTGLEKNLHEPELKVQYGQLPPEAYYKTIYNPEMQLHRGISPCMYKDLGGPLLGYSNPTEFWSTLKYLFYQTGKDSHPLYWTLFYLRDNGNTVDDLVEAIKHIPDWDDLELYLQSGQSRKLDNPDTDHCPLHDPRFPKRHRKMACAFDMPFRYRMSMFKRCSICPGSQPGVSQLCVSSHSPNDCGHAKTLELCKLCEEQTRHMKAWCPYHAYNSGTYDCVIYGENNHRLSVVFPL